MLVLRSLLLSTNAPINYTRSEVAAEPPTTNAVTSLDTAVKDVDTPSTWMDARLVTRKGIQLVMLENGTVAGSWNQSLTQRLGRLGKRNSPGRVGVYFFFNWWELDFHNVTWVQFWILHKMRVEFLGVLHCPAVCLSSVFPAIANQHLNWSAQFYLI